MDGGAADRDSVGVPIEPTIAGKLDGRIRCDHRAVGFDIARNDRHFEVARPPRLPPGRAMAFDNAPPIGCRDAFLQRRAAEQTDVRRRQHRDDEEPQDDADADHAGSSTTTGWIRRRRSVCARMGPRAGQGRADDRTGGVRARRIGVGRAGLAWRHDRRASPTLFGQPVAAVAVARRRRSGSPICTGGSGDARRNRRVAAGQPPRAEEAARGRGGAQGLVRTRSRAHDGGDTMGEWRCR